MAGVLNHLQETSSNEVDLDALFNFSDDYHNQLSGIVRHFKERDTLPHQHIVTVVNSLPSSNVGFNGSDNIVRSTSEVLNRISSPFRVTTSTVPNFNGGLLSQSSMVNGCTPNVTGDTQTVSPSALLTNRSDRIETSSAFSVPFRGQIAVPNTGLSKSVVGNNHSTDTPFVNNTSVMLRVASSSFDGGMVSSQTSASSCSAPVRSMCPATPVLSLSSQFQPVSVVRSSNGPAKLPVLLPQQRPVQLPNQTAVRFAVQPQLQRLNMSMNGMPQLLPGSVVMRNEHGQLIVVQQGHINGAIQRPNVLQSSVPLAAQPAMMNGMMNTSNSAVPFTSKSVNAPVGANPFLRLSNHQLQGIVNAQNGLQPRQVIIGRSPTTSGCYVVHTDVSSANGSVAQPIWVNSNSSYAPVSSNNIVIQSLGSSPNMVIRGPSSVNGAVVQQHLASSNQLSSGGVRNSVLSGAMRPAAVKLPDQQMPTMVQNGLQPAVSANNATEETRQVLKVKNFFTTLRKLAYKEAGNIVIPVTELIQKLIDAQLEPDDFTNQIEKLLKSSPQPGLATFLKVSLPLLRKALLMNTVQIEGIRPVSVAVKNQLSAGQLGVTQYQAQNPLCDVIIEFFSSAQPMMRSASMMQQLQMQMLLQQQLTASARMQAGSPHVVRAPVPGVLRPSMSGSRLASVPPSMTKTSSLQPSAAPGAAAARGEKRKYDLTRDDDDINDVAAMGGVNLTEESRNIMASNSELVAGQLRSCQDTTFLDRAALRARINAIVSKKRLVHRDALEVSPDIVDLVSHAVEHRLRGILEKLAVVTEHRVELYRNDPRFEQVSEVKPQLKFLMDVEALEKKRHEDFERQTLMKAAKSRAKSEDPEQLKLKERAKALQQAEMEQLHQKEANLTALAAIGPRKQQLHDNLMASMSCVASPAKVNSLPAGRIRRANLRDLIFIMEQDEHLKSSSLLFSACNK